MFFYGNTDHKAQKKSQYACALSLKTTTAGSEREYKI